MFFEFEMIDFFLINHITCEILLDLFSLSFIRKMHFFNDKINVIFGR